MRRNDPPIISVIGTGYVGLTTAVLLAEAGHRVYAVDINNDRLEAIKKGRSFFYEDGIDSLLSHAIKSGLLIPTNSYSQSIPESDFIFSCVGTPDNPDGSSNLSYVFSAFEEAAQYLKPGAIYIQKSTVPVGTGEQIELKYKTESTHINYVSNPEFMREGTAIVDSLWFDRIVVGSSNKESAQKVIDLYKSIAERRNEIAARAGIDPPNNNVGTYYLTNRNSAELIKVTANAFLALKISFANSIAKLADHTGADINEVMGVVGADRRIGSAFLNAGRGYGGGCFPKDVSGLISSANEHGVDLQIMISANDLNESMPGYIAKKAQNILGKLQGKRLAVLGLSFKAGTSDARRSPGVKLANILSHNNARVSTYDPEANGEAEEELRRGITVNNSLEEAAKDADAIFVTTDWPEFLSYDLGQLAKTMKGKLFIDCMNVFDIEDVQSVGLQYIGVGRNGKDK